MKTKFNLVSVFALVSVALSLVMTACASNPNVKKFEFQAYNVVNKQPTGSGYLYIKDDGINASVWYVFGSGMNKCDNTELPALRTESVKGVIYSVTPKLAGCDHYRYLLSKDGAKLIVQVKENDKWRFVSSDFIAK